MNYIDAIIIAIVEGVTEFLPVSSTGHMILTSACLGLENDAFLKTFEIFIQSGAIFAVVIMYLKRFFKSPVIYYKLFIAFLPTAIIGFTAYGFIKTYLFNPYVVSVSLILGGILLILLNRKIEESVSQTTELEDLSYKNSFLIGLIQCISMIPGVSRAAATIIGGIFNGFNKKQAIEFSFLLAVPTMFAATGYDLLKTSWILDTYQIKLLAVGLLVSFISAWLAVKWFLKVIEKYSFSIFGWYRIAIGILFLVLAYQKLIWIS
jgi:undecaprenyl-diphosphatase